ncbi:MAG: hypothetical protein GY703_11920 [Gammaproteobacteria bacterium]|nr:hypothetical protein [Gammaproteobacteria bacterium]
MVTRLILGAVIFVVGYRLGRTIGRIEPLRDELAQIRKKKKLNTKHEPEKNHTTTR